MAIKYVCGREWIMSDSQLDNSSSTVYRSRPLTVLRLADIGLCSVFWFV